MLIHCEWCTAVQELGTSKQREVVLSTCESCGRMMAGIGQRSGEHPRTDGKASRARRVRVPRPTPPFEAAPPESLRTIQRKTLDECFAGMETAGPASGTIQILDGAPDVEIFDDIEMTEAPPSATARPSAPRPAPRPPPLPRRGVPGHPRG